MVVFYLKSTPALLEWRDRYGNWQNHGFRPLFLLLLPMTYSSTGRSVDNDSHTIPLRSPMRMILYNVHAYEHAHIRTVFTL